FVGDIVPLRDLGVKLLAGCLIVSLTVVNYLGVKLGGWVQNIVTIGKVAAMAGLVLLVFIPPLGGRWANLTTNSPLIHRPGLAWWGAIAGALQGAFWAYDGWNKITYVAGEVKDPRRNIPRGLLWGMFLVTALYLVMNVAYAHMLPIDEMAGSKLV